MLYVFVGINRPEILTIMTSTRNLHRRSSNLPRPGSRGKGHSLSEFKIDSVGLGYPYQTTSFNCSSIKNHGEYTDPRPPEPSVITQTAPIKFNPKSTDQSILSINPANECNRCIGLPRTNSVNILLGKTPKDQRYKIPIHYNQSDNKIIPEIGSIYCVIDYHGKGNTYVVLQLDQTTLHNYPSTMKVAEVVAISDHLVYYDPTTITTHQLTQQGAWLAEDCGVHWGCIYHSDGLIPQTPDHIDVETFNYTSLPFPVRLGRLDNSTYSRTDKNPNFVTPVLPPHTLV